MPINNCKSTFNELANTALPRRMEDMNAAMSQPHKISLFSKKGKGMAYILREIGKQQDFQGCYVFIDDTAPVYVGISRSVIRRVIQHVKGKTHFDASLAYRMAEFNYSHDMSRGEAMQNEDFIKFFVEAKERLSKMKLAFIEITCDLELYLFEVYCSMELDTAQWNSFRTH